MKLRTLVVIICALIILGAAALTQLDLGDDTPQTPTPVDQPVTASPPPPPARDLETLQPVEFDAGAPPRLREVRIRVTKKGITAVGERLTLKGRFEEVGGTVDTMGNLVLPLAPGDWYVSPRAEPKLLRIGPDTTEASVTLLGALVMSGRVVDPSGQPVATAVVQLQRNAVPTSTVVTGADGAFVIPAPTDEVYAVQATLGSQRSRTHYARPQEGVTLVLEPVWDFTVSASGPGAHVARLVVRHRFGMNTCIKTCIVPVPEGEVVSSAVSFDGTKLTAAKPTTDVVKSKTGRTLKLDAVPPLTGRLLDQQNNPVAGATLRLNRFDLGNAGYLDPAAMPKPMGFDYTATTANDGSFTVNFPLENFPIWVLTADPPLELDHRVLVVPFDGPLDVRTK